MKILAAVMGAIPHAALHQVSRETWGQDFSQIGDLRFFIGHGDYELKADEVRVDCPDDKDHILYKTVELLKWALAREYDLIFKLDTDTYCNVDEIVKRDYSGYDYVGAPVGNIGDFYSGTNCYSFLQGSATWVSAKAARIVIDEAIPTMNRVMPAAMAYNGLICPYPHSEDLWIGQALTPHIKSGYLRALPDWSYSDGPYTYHFARSAKHKMERWMRALHDARPNLERMQEIHRARDNE